MLAKVKLALQIASSDTTWDAELTASITAAVKDMNIAGADADSIATDTTDSLAERAIITYCLYQFELMHGNLNRADKLKAVYDEMKGTLSNATGYTEWSDENA